VPGFSDGIASVTAMTEISRHQQELMQQLVQKLQEGAEAEIRPLNRDFWGLAEMPRSGKKGKAICVRVEEGVAPRVLTRLLPVEASI